MDIEVNNKKYELIKNYKEAFDNDEFLSKCPSSRVAAETLASKIQDVVVEVKVKATAEGNVYGSVTNAHVADALKEQHNIELDKKKIVLLTTIKELGDFTVNVPLHKEVKAEFTVRVVAE